MSRHQMPFGATVLDGSDTCFRLWAPAADRIVLDLAAASAPTQQHLMTRAADGWHVLTLAAPAGSRYAYRLPDGSMVPDPASRFNPDGVHAPSEVVDPQRHAWADAPWRGRPWHEAVICEIHIGTFTEAGTFAAAADRLADLAATGYTAVEIMPVAAFAGERGWGYDGVLPFAPHAAYGTPDDFKALIDLAHAIGLMVLLDVVYNHFGPDGNHLHAYAPGFFNSRHHTPWGAALNFDSPDSNVVRHFFRHNALYWIEEFHLDGLRLDAVHGMVDDSPRHIVGDIAAALRDGPGRTRHVHLVLENEANQASFLERDAADGVPLCATAQWNDDFHHAAHVLLTTEAESYYEDYATNPPAHLARALAEGFVYQGDASAHRHNAPRGEPSAHLPPTAFVAFLQNHDQIGNRAFGDRLVASTRFVEAMYVCLLLAPQIPMLFMGEEFAASTPFLFFCNFSGDLAEAVSTGRRAEFAQFTAFRDAATRQHIPDPGAHATFMQAKLRWSERTEPPHAQRLAFIRELIALRRQQLVPRLAGARQGNGVGEADDAFVRVRWHLPDGTMWTLFANFGPVSRTVKVDTGTRVYARGIRRSEAAHVEVEFEPGATLVSFDAEHHQTMPIHKGR